MTILVDKDDKVIYEDETNEVVNYHNDHDDYFDIYESDFEYMQYSDADSGL